MPCLEVRRWCIYSIQRLSVKIIFHVVTTICIIEYLGDVVSNFDNHAIVFIISFLCLTHWGRVTHICVGKLTIIGSDNGLSPGRRQAIIWTNAGILLIGTLGTNFSEILIEIRIFSFKKMGLKVSSAKWRLFCLGLNLLMNSWMIYISVGASQLSVWCIQLSSELPILHLCLTWHFLGHQMNKSDERSFSGTQN